MGDIHPDGHNFVNLGKQMARSCLFGNLILKKLHRIPGRIEVNACVKYLKKIFIGVGNINPVGQNFKIFCQFEQTNAGRENKNAALQNKWVLLHTSE